jgi:hypothetical protein
MLASQIFNIWNILCEFIPLCPTNSTLKIRVFRILFVHKELYQILQKFHLNKPWQNIIYKVSNMLSNWPLFEWFGNFCHSIRIKFKTLENFVRFLKKSHRAFQSKTFWKKCFTQQLKSSFEKLEISSNKFLLTKVQMSRLPDFVDEKFEYALINSAEPQMGFFNIQLETRLILYEWR